MQNAWMFKPCAPSLYARRSTVHEARHLLAACQLEFTVTSRHQLSTSHSPSLHTPGLPPWDTHLLAAAS
jgi:hypothetical protein